MPELKKKNTNPFAPSLEFTPKANRFDPFAQPDPFQAVPGGLPAPHSGPAPSNVTGGTEFSGLAANSSASNAGIPQSYVDGIADLLQRDRAAGNTHTSFNGIQDRSRFEERDPNAQMSQQEFDAYVQATWQAAPPDQKQRYLQADQEAIAGINRTNLQNRAVEVALGAPELNRQQMNNYWSTKVAPLEREDQAAYDRMVSGNRAREAEYSGNVTDYTNTIRGNEAARMDSINRSNAEQQEWDNKLWDETLAANQRNVGYGQEWTNAANQTNAAQSQLFNDYRTSMQGYNQQQSALASQNASTLNGISAAQSARASQLEGEMRGYNAEQTGHYNRLGGDVANANSIQNMNLGQFGYAVQGANQTANANLANLGARTGEYNQRQSQFLDDFSYEANRATGNQQLYNSQFQSQIQQSNHEQQALLNTYQRQLASMNTEDRAAYMQYLSETNPLMAERLAQGSNAEYVGNMEDVVSRYKAQSTPEVTGQERFTAELARRKFESDDRSAREAQMQALAARGLRSGGLQIANQQATRQQLAQDRQLNELGLQAQAVQRAERGLAGYEASAANLRAADDNMRNFQDQYRQNEAVRVGNLAQQRNNQSLQTNWQTTQRDTLGYNAGTQTVRDIHDRNQAGYNANTQTNELNYGRQRDVYDAQTQTNNLNYGRDLNYYTAANETNNQNYARDRDYYGAATETNNLNYGRNLDLYNAGTQTTSLNSGRTFQAAEYTRATNNDNSTRANDIFNNGTTALSNNTLRDAGIFDAGTRTNEGNYGRTTEAIGTNMGINQTNLGNFGTANREMSAGVVNRAREFQGGLDAGNRGAGSILEAQGGSINQRTNNAATESGLATGRAGAAAGRASVFGQQQQATTDAQQEALARALGFANLDEMRRAQGVA